MLCNSSWSWYTGHWLVECTRCNSSAIMGSVSIMLLLCIWCLLAGHISVLTRGSIHLLVISAKWKMFKIHRQTTVFHVNLSEAVSPCIIAAWWIPTRNSLITRILASCTESWWKWCLYIASVMPVPELTILCSCIKIWQLTRGIQKVCSLI